MSTMNDAIEQRKEVLMTIKTERKLMMILRCLVMVLNWTPSMQRKLSFCWIKYLISKSAKVTTRPICAVSIVWPPSLFKRKTINYLLKN